MNIETFLSYYTASAQCHRSSHRPGGMYWSSAYFVLALAACCLLIGCADDEPFECQISRNNAQRAVAIAGDCSGEKDALKGADLAQAQLEGIDLSDVDLSGANLSRANLSRAFLTDAVLNEANLFRVNLNEATLFRADFTGAYLEGADMSSADITGVVWKDTVCPDGTLSSEHEEETCRGHLGISAPIEDDSETNSE